MNNELKNYFGDDYFDGKSMRTLDGQGSLLQYYINLYAEDKDKDVFIAGMILTERYIKELINDIRFKQVHCVEDMYSNLDIDARLLDVRRMLEYQGGLIGNIYDLDIVKPFIDFISRCDDMSSGDALEKGAVIEAHMVLLGLMKGFLNAALSPMDTMRLTQLFNMHNKEYINNLHELQVCIQNINTVTFNARMSMHNVLHQNKANVNVLTNIYKFYEVFIKKYIASALKNMLNFDHFKTVTATIPVISNKRGALWSYPRTMKGEDVTTVKDVLLGEGIIDEDFNLLIQPYDKNDIKEMRAMLDGVADLVKEKTSLENQYKATANEIISSMIDEFEDEDGCDVDERDISRICSRDLDCVDINNIKKAKELIDSAIDTYEKYKELLNK